LKNDSVNNPPKNLSLAARRHWARITKDYELTSDAAMLLETGLANWDMAQEARKLIRKEGMVLNGRRHPAIEIQKLGDSLYMRAMRELGLNISDPGEAGRPPESLGANSSASVSQEELF
jgi:phage terminase small subunit